MITTTVVWPQTNNESNPGADTSAALNAIANTLSPGTPSELTSVLSSDGLELVAMRTWPSQDIAQQWVDYVLANYNVTSAVVNNV
jgi:hypothetical protein